MSEAAITADKAGNYTVVMDLDEALSENQELYDISGILTVKVPTSAIRLKIKVYLEGAL